MQTFTIGPLALPAALLLGLAAFLVAGALAGYVGRRKGGDAEPHLYGMLLAGVLAARTAFVVQSLDAYRQAPWTMLDVRDGGWNFVAGLLAAGAYALVLFVLRAPLRASLVAAVTGAAAVWGGGMLLLATPEGDRAQLPALALPALDGTEVALASFHGKPLVVNLWATWCPPCRREMPVLQQAQAARGDVHFVFLNQGESAATVQHFVATQGLPLRNVLLDARGAVGVQLGHRALPTTLFFDARGRLVDTRVGELSRASLDQRLARLARNEASP